MQFEELEVNDRFYDPFSGEYFVKVCANAAENVTGGDYFTGSLVTFDPNEPVEVAP